MWNVCVGNTLNQELRTVTNEASRYTMWPVSGTLHKSVETGKMASSPRLLSSVFIATCLTFQPARKSFSLQSPHWNYVWYHSNVPDFPKPVVAYPTGSLVPRLLPSFLNEASISFVACSTNAGEGLVKLSHVVWRTWTCGGVAHSFCTAVKQLSESKERYQDCRRSSAQSFSGLWWQSVAHSLTCRFSGNVPLLHTSRYVIPRDSVLPGLPPH